MMARQDQASLRCPDCDAETAHQVLETHEGTIRRAACSPCGRIAGVWGTAAEIAETRAQRAWLVMRRALRERASAIRDSPYARRDLLEIFHMSDSILRGVSDTSLEETAIWGRVSSLDQGWPHGHADPTVRKLAREICEHLREVHGANR